MPDGSLLSTPVATDRLRTRYAADRAGRPVVVKATAAAPPNGDPLEFVMSDESVDRFGDIIVAGGWQLGNFRKNPMGLFGHNNNFIVGNWFNVRVDGNRLVGRLELLPPVSERLQELHTAIEHRMLRAVSVGFIPHDAEEIENTLGLRFTKSELIECSQIG